MSTARWQIVEVPTSFTIDALMGGSVYPDILDNGRMAIPANHAVIPGSGKHSSPALELCCLEVSGRGLGYFSGIDVHALGRTASISRKS